VLEVVSDLRRTAAELAKPIDRSLLAAGDGLGEAIPPKLALSAYIDPEVLIPNLNANNKPAVLDELLQLATRSNLIRDQQAARDALLAREESGSTGMQNGVALPHAQTHAVDQFVCAIGLKPDGIDFDSLDGQPSRVFVLLLSPEGDNVSHLRALSTIGRLFDEVLCASLLRCRTAEAMYKTLLTYRDSMTGLPRSDCSTRRTSSLLG
jgi:mannitol/fructose-specific phosphotransferase system IIA component (Ntr-type)